jgi:hypothetical protein
MFASVAFDTELSDPLSMSFSIVRGSNLRTIRQPVTCIPIGFATILVLSYEYAPQIDLLSIFVLSLARCILKLKLN